MDTTVLPSAVEAFVNAFKSLGGGELAEQTIENTVRELTHQIMQGDKYE